MAGLTLSISLSLLTPSKYQILTSIISRSRLYYTAFLYTAYNYPYPNFCVTASGLPYLGSIASLSMMNPPSSSELSPNCPASLWLQHKDTLHRLYIIQNKTLSIVKQIMEDEYQFPTQRLCDYEVALREILKFRKNLKQEEWYAIGIHIFNRKNQAKESEVIWNGTRLEAKKVRKDVLRNSRVGKRCIRNRRFALITSSVTIIQYILDNYLPKSAATLELPHGLVFRTPPGSPTACVPVLAPSTESETAHTNSFLNGGEGDSLHISPSSVFDDTIGEVQLAWAEAQASQFGVSPTRKLRENLPFNRFMLRLWKLVAQSRSFDALIPAGQAWTPTPRLFGVNPSWDLLGRHVFELSNKNNQDWIIDENAWFLRWISISADFAVLRAFFSINSPTVGAVYERLRTITGRLKRPELLRVLFELKDTLRVYNATSVNEVEFVSVAIEIGSRSDGMLDIVRFCESNTPPLATRDLRQWWREPSSLVAASRCDMAILQVLVATGWDKDIDATYRGFSEELVGYIMSRIYGWSPQEENNLTVYLDILIRGGILDINLSPLCIDDDRPGVAIENIYSITWDELVMVCPPMMRKTLYSILVGLAGGQGISVTKAGIFTAAQDGVLGLRAYLETNGQADSLLTCVILEESLLFAAILNDPTTASVLLRIGVDPCAGRLSNNLEHYYKGNLPWNPSIVAAAAGSLEVLTLLVSKISLASFLDSVPIYELVHPLSPENRPDITERELRRLEGLRRSYLFAQTRSTQPGVEGDLDEEFDSFRRWIPFIVSGRRFDTLEYIRKVAKTQGCGGEIDLEIIKAAVLDNENRPWLQRHNRHLPCEVLLMEGLVEANLNYEEQGMDLLQLSIRNHCSLKVAQFLLDKGLQVHSRTATESCHTMLHDALLSHSPDRLEIIELLLLEGADYKLCGDGLTILEASLWTVPHDSSDRSQKLEIFTRLFKAGAPVYHWPRKGLPKWRPLVSLLLRAGADDDLVLQVLDAGADLNTTGYDYDNPPLNEERNLNPVQASLVHGRERLARELIRRGANVHASAFQHYGLTALQAACRCGVSISLLEYLVTDLGVKVDEHRAKTGGLASLCAAAQNGSLNTVEFLLDHGADVNAMSDRPSPFYFIGNPDQQTIRPLDQAVFAGKLDMVELLLKAGGRSSTAGLGGAMGIAKRQRHFAILSVLRRWNEEHGRQILEEEALWQSKKSKEALLLSE